MSFEADELRKMLVKAEARAQKLEKKLRDMGRRPVEQRITRTGDVTTPLEVRVAELERLTHWLEAQIKKLMEPVAWDARPPKIRALSDGGQKND